MFEQCFVNRNPQPGRKASVAISFFLQVAVILGLIVLPMVFFEDLPGVVLAATLEAPEPPPPLPPPPTVQPTTPTPRIIRQFEADRLLQPRTIPDKPAIIVDEVPDFAGPAGVTTQRSANLDFSSLIGSSPEPIAPPAPPPIDTEPEVVQRFRVGGDVQPPSQLSAEQPDYPRIAIQTHTQGEVRLEAIIGVDGRVHDVHPLSGHPLLVPAAIEAVRRWVYQPTTLNGTPVEVVMVVTVNFRLSR